MAARMNRSKSSKAYNTSETDILKLHADIVNTVRIETELNAGSWKDVLRSDQLHSRRRFLISCSIQVFQQLGGINAVTYYSGTIFNKSIRLRQAPLRSHVWLPTNLALRRQFHPLVPD